LKKVDASNKNVRIAGEPDSPQNRLRAELYGEAFERINRGIKDKRYFEVIALADSIITDRVQALTQDIIRDEPEQYAWMSVGGAVASLLKEVKTRSITLPPELRRLLIQALSFWSEKRNIASHGFVVITPKNLEQGLESRLENLKDAAVEGGYLARNITDEIDKFRSQKI
jgi:hypothetical protein